MDSAIWSQLPSDLLQRILLFLPQNELACTARLISKDIAGCYCGPQHKYVRLAQLVPQHAFTYKYGPASQTWRGIRLWEKRKILRLTAATGSLENLQQAASVVGWIFDSSVMEAAAGTGHLHICKWLSNFCCRSVGRSLVPAAAGGHQTVVDWLLSADGIALPETMLVREAQHAAARGGHETLLDSLLSRMPPDSDLLVAAAEGCRLAKLTQLLAQHPTLATPSVQDRTFAAAAASPTPDWPDKLAFLVAQGYRPTCAACFRVADLPDAADRLAHLVYNVGCPVQDELQPLTEHVATRGNLAALQYVVRLAGIPVADPPGVHQRQQHQHNSSASTAGVGREASAEGSISSGGGGGIGGFREGGREVEPEVGAGRRKDEGRGEVVQAGDLTSASSSASRMPMSSPHGAGRGRFPGLSGWVLAGAAASPTSDWRAKVEWLEALGCPRTSRPYWRVVLLPDAAERLAWLWDRKYPVLNDGLLARVVAGSTDPAVLRFFFPERLRGWRDVLVVMANIRRRACLVRLLSPKAVAAGCCPAPASPETCLGLLSVAVWLEDELPRIRVVPPGPHGGSGDAGLGAMEMEAAAWLGNVGLLEWLLIRGGRLKEGTFRAAVRGGCEETVEWLVQQGCPVPDNGSPYVDAAVNGDLAMLRCLRRLGCSPGTSRTFTGCVGSPPYAPLPALRWLAEQGRCPVRWSAALQAVAWRYTEDRQKVAAWLAAEARRRAWWRALWACGRPQTTGE